MPSDASWTQILLFLTTVAGFVYTAWRESRTRRWATEDRIANTLEIVTKAKAEAEATRIKTEAVAEALRVEGVRVAAQLREEARIAAEVLRVQTATNAADIKRHGVIEAARIRETQQQAADAMMLKIEETKDAANEAYKEANHVNRKIENLNDRLVAQSEKQDGLSAEAATTIEHIDQRGAALASQGADTNIRVRAIEQQTGATTAAPPKPKK